QAPSLRGSRNHSNDRLGESNGVLRHDRPRSAVPQTMLSPSAVPHTILSPSLPVPQTMLSPSLPVPQTMLSPSPAVPHTMLPPQSAPPQSVPHTMLSPSALVPQTMLSPSPLVPHTMLSPSPAVPHTMLSPQSELPHDVPQTMLSPASPSVLTAPQTVFLSHAFASGTMMPPVMRWFPQKNCLLQIASTGTRPPCPAASIRVGPLELKPATSSSLRVNVPIVLDAPTVMTHGAFAGDVTAPQTLCALSSRPSLPAATTITTPPSTNALVASASGSCQ